MFCGPLFGRVMVNLKDNLTESCWQKALLGRKGDHILDVFKMNGVSESVGTPPEI